MNFTEVKGQLICFSHRYQDHEGAMFSKNESGKTRHVFESREKNERATNIFDIETYLFFTDKSTKYHSFPLPSKDFLFAYFVLFY